MVKKTIQKLLSNEVVRITTIGIGSWFVFQFTKNQIDKFNLSPFTLLLLGLGLIYIGIKVFKLKK